MRTELSVGWTRRTLRELARTHRFEVLGMGEDTFVERMISLNFGAWANLVRLKRVLALLGHWRIRQVLARLIILLRGWSPIILTLRKLP